MPKNPMISEQLDEASPSKIDFKLSWYMLRKNLRPYALISIFSIFSALLLTFIFGVLIVMLSIAIAGPEIAQNETYRNILSVGLALPIMFLIYAFYGSGYGLAYDIMSSGDEFAQFKGAFSYFKRYWWQYTLISLIYSAPGIILNPTILPFDSIDSIGIQVLIHFVFQIITFLWFTIIGMALPAITAHDNLRESLGESIKLFRNNLSRYARTWGLFFILFQIPVFGIMEFYSLSLNTSDTISIGMGGLILIGYLFSTFIVFPMQTLISTRLYNSILNPKEE